MNNNTKINENEKTFSKLDKAKSVQRTMSLLGVLTILLGLVLIVFPENAINFICMAIGIILLIAGIVTVISYFRTKKIMGESRFISIAPLIVGFLEGTIGISILINSAYFISFLTFIFAMILLLHGINDIVKGIHMKKLGYQKWLTPIIFGLIGIIFALIVFFNPFFTASALTVLIGIALIIDGLTEVIVAFMFSSSIKENERNNPKVIDVEYTNVEEDDE